MSAEASRSATPPQTRSTDDVYTRLRREIVEGDLRPNVRLIETELADRLDVSRTPIREALQRLAADGLIRGRPRGWVVHEHTRDEVRQIYEARIALEGFATYLAADRASDEEVEAIAAVHADSVAREQNNELREALVDLDFEFHAAIFAAARNEHLAELIGKNRDFYFNHRIASVYSDAELHNSLVTQSAIVDALRRRDPAAAEAAARKHVEQALAVILTKLR